MRRSIWASRVVSSLLLAIGSLFGLAAAINVPPALAATSTIIPLHSLRSQDCTGETVELVGNLHLVSQVQPDGSIVGHFNYQGVTATGETSGIVYRATSVDNIVLRAPVPSDVTSVGNLHLLGPGPDNNLLVRTLYHLTINANGELTASIDEISSVCN